MEHPEYCFQSKELSGKSFVSVFICNLMLDCSRDWLWHSVLVLYTFYCIKTFCSFLTPNFSGIISLGNCLLLCLRQSSRGSHKQLSGIFVGEFPYLSGKKILEKPGGNFA